MSFSLILSITDTQPLRGFIPDSVDDSQERMSPAFATRVWAQGFRNETEKCKLQEKIQHIIHGVNEPQPHLNAWYLSNVEDCKKVLDGILKVLRMPRPNFLEETTLQPEESGFSKTLHYLSVHKHLTQAESDEYHRAFHVDPYPQVTVTLGLIENTVFNNMTGIFFMFKFEKADSEQEDRYLSLYARKIQKYVSEENKNIPSYSTVVSKTAVIVISDLRMILNAMLKADWKEYRPFWHQETCQIDKISFNETLSLMGKQKLLSPEEVNHYTKEFFNGAE